MVMNYLKQKCNSNGFDTKKIERIRAILRIKVGRQTISWAGLIDQTPNILHTKIKNEKKRIKICKVYKQSTWNEHLGNIAADLKLSKDGYRLRDHYTLLLRNIRKTHGENIIIVPVNSDRDPMKDWFPTLNNARSLIWSHKKINSDLWHRKMIFFRSQTRSRYMWRNNFDADKKFLYQLQYDLKTKHLNEKFPFSSKEMVRIRDNVKRSLKSQDTFMNTKVFKIFDWRFFRHANARLRGKLQYRNCEWDKVILSFCISLNNRKRVIDKWNLAGRKTYISIHHKKQKLGYLDVWHKFIYQRRSSMVAREKGIR